jgi:hypothetical protein
MEVDSRRTRSALSGELSLAREHVEEGAGIRDGAKERLDDKQRGFVLG